jgi:hypothetical protein
MRDVLDLDACPRHLLGSQKWTDLVEKCRRDLAKNGMVFYFYERCRVTFSNEDRACFHGNSA